MISVGDGNGSNKTESENKNDIVLLFEIKLNSIPDPTQQCRLFFGTNAYFIDQQL